MIRNELAALEARLAEARAASLAATAAVEAALSKLTGEPAPAAPVLPPWPLTSEPALALPAPARPPEPPPNIPENIPAEQDEPVWMAHAWAGFGVRETAGAAHNARVVAYYRDAGHPEVRDDETAWCAAYAGACLERAGVRSTRSLMARSYLKWGKPLGTRPPDLIRGYGAVAVFSRGSDPSAGHVGFVVGAAGDQLFILGGNQSNAVSVQAFPRSRLLPDGLRWAGGGFAPRVPVPFQAEPVQAEPIGDADNIPAFAVSLAHVLQPDIEGGWSDDPDDPGGATNYGITIGDYARYKGVPPVASHSAALKERLRRIPAEEVRDIYLLFYWREGTCAALPAPVALFHFDCGVNQGVGTAARLLQRALQVDADGEIGPITLGAARAAPPMALLQAYAELRRARYRASRNFWKYGRGWLTRVDKTLATASAVANAIPA